MVQVGTLTQPASPPQPPPGTPPLHPEIRSIVQLTAAHAHKIYFSGPLIRRIERQSDGHKPHKDDGWCDVWAQLGGTTLSIWDMKQIQEANKRGKQVPPAYVNVTDAVCSLSLVVLACSVLILAAVRASSSSHDCSSHRDFSRNEIRQYFHSKYGRIKSYDLLVPKRSGIEIMGRSIEAERLGEITSGGNLHCPSD
jgi:hypothetical protein